MFRSVPRLCSMTSVTLSQRAGHKNFVSSDSLAQMEKDCERCCPVPRLPPQKVTLHLMYHHRRALAGVKFKVTVLGAGGDVGQIASLFLKQQNVVKVLALYDDIPEKMVVGVATDIAHIDTSTKVEAYQGRTYLKTALHDSDVVVICGGLCIKPPYCSIPDRDLFFHNMPYVRTMAVSCSAFCPQAIIVVATPPVDCNYSMVAHTLKISGKFDRRRVLGFNSVSAMRSNQLYCAFSSQETAGSRVPVVCGTGPTTRVPVFSAGKAKNFPAAQVDGLTRLVREADDIICRVKNNGGHAHLSIGFSLARLVVNCMNGLFKKSSFVDSALVEQADPAKCYNMPVCATPITMGKAGIAEFAIPSLNAYEADLLEKSRCDLEDMLNLGRCYAIGEDYQVHTCKIKPPTIPPPCPVCQPCNKPKKIDHKKVMLPSNYECKKC